MPRKKQPKQPLPFSELNQKLAEVGLPAVLSNDQLPDHYEQLPEGLRNFMDFLKPGKTPFRKAEDMYCLIMYDIESNRIRRLMAKYLEQKGAMRVQKSVFFARFHRKLQKEVVDMLRRMHDCYDNEDSILVLPVGEDMLGSLTCIGKEFELQLITAPKHTLFF